MFVALRVVSRHQRIVQRSLLEASSKAVKAGSRAASHVSVMSREMASKTGERVESDTMGEMRVAADRYWGAQTQRSKENFKIGEER